MHASALENMRRCVDRAAGVGFFGEAASTVVLDLASHDLSGSYRPLFDQPGVRYIGADLVAGPDVDVVLEDPYRFPFDDGSVDVVVSGQMLEHCELFWKSFTEMVRVLADDGLIFLIAPSAGPMHGYPVDCYRFYPDSYEALARMTGTHLVDWWIDGRGPWHDLVGIFGRRPHTLPARPHRARAAPWRPPPDFDRNPQQGRGEVDRRDFVGELCGIVSPELYVEIGVARGHSLRQARCRALGVDPAPEMEPIPPEMEPIPPETAIYEMTSDDFFEFEAAGALTERPDVVYVDGRHEFAFVLRDFMNVELWSKPTTVLLLDDIFPNNEAQVAPVRRTDLWSGDVWKITEVLRQHRPDLTLLPLDVAPCGALIVLGLDPDNRTLWEHYNPLVEEFAGQRALPRSVIDRVGVLSPRDPRVVDLVRRHATRDDREQRPA